MILSLTSPLISTNNRLCARTAKEAKMAVVLRFTPQGMTTAKYDEIIKRLEQAGAGAPAGRLYHVCFGDKDNLRVSDIWDSTESFERFRETLRPILQELGLDPGEPEVIDVYNIIEGTKTTTAAG
jgi:hypothetical protein